MPIQALSLLRQKLKEVAQQEYPTSSRIHPLRSLTSSTTPCFVKREDELGFGVSGVKFRKYRVLISHLLAAGFKEAIVIGGAFSNHILSITQLLIENGIQPTLFLKGPRPASNRGNFLLTQLLIPPSSIHWISKSEWQQVDSLALDYAKGRSNATVIPEGATLFPSFLGALTLPLDIVRNEEEAGCTFEHIFFDVGTGYSAAALLLGLAFLKKSCNCHLLLLADTEPAFMQLLHKLHGEFQQWLGVEVPFPAQFQLLECSIAPSFGSTSRELFNFIAQMARSEGFFLDPIYSAKLFFQARECLREPSSIRGNTLIIHSGGALTLSGFQEKLEGSILEGSILEGSILEGSILDGTL